MLIILQMMQADLMKPIPLSSSSQDVLTCVGVTTYLEPHVIVEWCKVVKTGHPWLNQKFYINIFNQVDTFCSLSRLLLWINGERHRMSLRTEDSGRRFMRVSLFSISQLSGTQVKRGSSFLFIKSCESLWITIFV